MPLYPNAALPWCFCGVGPGRGVVWTVFLREVASRKRMFYVVLRDFTPPQTMFYVIHPPEKYVSRDVTPRNR